MAGDNAPKVPNLAERFPQTRFDQDKACVDLQDYIDAQRTDYELGKAKPLTDSEMEREIEEKGRYAATGEVNSEWHTISQKRSDSWYAKKSKAAVAFLRNMDKIKTNFGSLCNPDEAKKMTVLFAVMAELGQGETTHERWVDLLSRGNIDPNENFLRDADGLYNILLSVERAAHAAGGYDNLEKMEVIQLKLGDSTSGYFAKIGGGGADVAVGAMGDMDATLMGDDGAFDEGSDDENPWGKDLPSEDEIDQSRNPWGNEAADLIDAQNDLEANRRRHEEFMEEFIGAAEVKKLLSPVARGEANEHSGVLSVEGLYPFFLGETPGANPDAAPVVVAYGEIVGDDLYIKRQSQDAQSWETLKVVPFGNHDDMTFINIFDALADIHEENQKAERSDKEGAEVLVEAAKRTPEAMYRAFQLSIFSEFDSHPLAQVDLKERPNFPDEKMLLIGVPGSKSREKVRVILNTKEGRYGVRVNPLKTEWFELDEVDDATKLAAKLYIERQN